MPAPAVYWREHYVELLGRWKQLFDLLCRIEDEPSLPQELRELVAEATAESLDFALRQAMAVMLLADFEESTDSKEDPESPAP